MIFPDENIFYQVVWFLLSAVLGRFIGKILIEKWFEKADPFPKNTAIGLISLGFVLFLADLVTQISFHSNLIFWITAIAYIISMETILATGAGWQFKIIEEVIALPIGCVLVAVINTQHKVLHPGAMDFLIALTPLFYLVVWMLSWALLIKRLARQN